MPSALEPKPPNVTTPLDNFQGFGNRLPTFRVIKIIKIKGKKNLNVLFKQYLIDNPKYVMILHWIECAFHSMYSTQCWINCNFVLLDKCM